MKNKPTSHKTTNTFKFLTAQEQISNVNIHALRFGKTTEVPEDGNTFFEEAVEKWNDLNYTEDYDALRSEIGFEIQTLSQVLFRKEEIIAALLKTLSNPENMALDAALEFVWALAKDLRSDFYAYFQQFFQVLTKLLTTKDTQILEKTFICLSQLFRFLSKYLVADMQNIFRLFSTLLTEDNKEHIRQFAAETFAFLIRKVPDKRTFVIFIFNAIRDDEKIAHGLGQLLFEVIKGVKGQLRRCGEEGLFLELFKCLGDGSFGNEYENLPVQLTEEALHQTLKALSQFISKDHCLFIEDTFLQMLRDLLEKIKVKGCDSGLINHIEAVFRLLLFWINSRSGMLISTNTKLFDIVQYFSSIKMPLSSQTLLCNVIASLLLTKHIDVPLETLNHILNYIYDKASDPNLVFDFTRKMFVYSMFEKDILHPLLLYCCDVLKGNDTLEGMVLELLTEVVISFKPLKKQPEDVKKFLKLPLFSPFQGEEGISHEENQFLEHTVVKVLQTYESMCLEDIPKIWNCIICIPHFRSLSKDLVIDLLESTAKSVLKFLNDEISRSPNCKESFLFVLLEAFFSWKCVGGDLSSTSCFTADYFIDLLTEFPDSISILCMYELFLYTNPILSAYSEVELSSVVSILLPNLKSPFHLVRLHSLKILSFYRNCFHSLNEGEVKIISVFDICLEAERVPATVHDYRAKLKWLQKLEFPFVKKHLPTELPDCEMIPVRYILGCLYINFKLLWQPLFNILQSLAHGVEKSFWEVFNPHLIQATTDAENLNVKGINPFHSEEANFAQAHSLFAKSMTSLCKHLDNPDAINYRELLWKAMASFPTVVQPRSKDIAPLVFRFIKNEIARVDYTLASSETLVKNQESDNSLHSSNIYDDNEDYETDENDDEAGENAGEVDDENNEISPMKKQKVSDNESVPTMFKDKSVESSENENFEDKDVENENLKNKDMENENLKDKGMSRKRKRMSSVTNHDKKRRGVLKTLTVTLSLLSKFEKVKLDTDHTKSLKKLYYELLTYHDEGIQRLSFDCILTYGPHFLNPYKEHFYKILDNKTFKTEIVLFGINAEQEVILEKHRMDALNVLMRILYGKMLHKTGNNTTGKSQAHTRKALVLRFLAGCRPDEIKMFFDLVFAPFLDYIKDDVMVMVHNIQQSINPHEVIPIRKMHSALNTLEIILQNAGSLFPNLQHWFLKILLIIASLASSLLKHREELVPSTLMPLKLVRRQAIMRLIQFFKLFDYYNFTPGEIDAIFEAIVWPALPRLEFEALRQPPPLLRLFDIWSSNSRFFIFFAKHHEEKEDLFALPRLMALYNSKQARPRVLGLLSKMFFQLLTLPDFESIKIDEKTVLPIQINCCISVAEVKAAETKDAATFGVRLLYPYVDLLLSQLKISVLKAAKNTKRAPNLRDLNILLKISEFIEDASQCSELIELLLTFFSNRHKLNSESEALILSTICSLLKHAYDVKKFIKFLSPLFSFLSHQRSRQSLVDVFSVLAEKDSSIQNLANTVYKINALNPNLIEEPDYQSRLDGHNEALSFISSMTSNIEKDFIQIVIYNSAFVIRTCDDMALRDSASHLLQQVVKKFSDFLKVSPKLYEVFIFETLLPEIRQGLKNKTEAVRSEFIRILSSLLQSCGDHKRLQHLAQLCDKDLDMDFWQNVLHLQVHRRARGLLRFASQLKSKEIQMHPSMLTTYMIPIVSSFFFDAAYKKHVHVIDAAIETFQVIASFLPWPNYELLLRYYLDLLLKNTENHKTVVKIIVAILNAFHFDLSLSRGLQENAKPPSSLTKNDKISETKSEEKENEEESENCKHERINENKLSDFNESPNEESEASVLESTNAKKEILTEEKATKIHNIIAKNILPKLKKSLMHKAKSDNEHKLAGKSFPEDEEILRVPVALAVVKLLQNLPKESLKRNIPGLFLRMCQLLKSRSESIRETARDTLIKMMQSLGPYYVSFLLREMKSVMKKGYQVHVMTFTINAILLNLKDLLKSGDLDECISDVTEICTNELFGNISEEKEVVKILGKLKEARSSKSYSLYEILSQFISEPFLWNLVTPLQNTLNTARSHKVVKKCQECLRHIALGLSENTGLSTKGQLIFIYKLMSENLATMNPKSDKKVEVEEKYKRPDIFLIPTEPGRGGPPAKTSVKTNVHVLVEFSLQLLHFCLKRGKLNPAITEHLELLDPFVPMVSVCIDSNYIKVITVSLRCLMWILKFALPSLEKNAASLVKSLFVLINKHAGVGMGQGENFEMVVMCFKMLTVVVRDTDYYTLSESQLKVLLSYVEQDIYDHTRQATAFSLLKAILLKKLESPELNSIMKKIAEMSIVSDQDHIRTQCRQASLQYILEYSHGKTLPTIFGFYISQMEYQHEHGRISAMEIISSILHNFPVNIIKRHSGLFFTPLAARLVNDEASKCRKMAAELIKDLLIKLGHDERAKLFSVASAWLENSKLSHKRLGIQLAGLFAEVEKKKFERVLPDLLPIIEKELGAAKMIEISSATDERCLDHFLYHLLNAFSKILTHCFVITNSKFSSTLYLIWGNLQKLVLHPHSWIRLLVSQLFGLLFSSYSVEEVLKCISVQKDENTHFMDKRQKLRDLSADFITQLQSPYLNDNLGEQIVKNLVYLGKIIAQLPKTSSSSPKLNGKANKMVDHNIEVTITWMLKKLTREAAKEVAQAPQNSIKRKHIFQFFAAISVELPKDVLLSHVEYIFTPLCREILDSSVNIDQSLTTLAQEALNILKSVFGAKVYNEIIGIIQNSVIKKKVQRKRDKLKEAVTNPEKFAKKKMKKQQNKKDAKKRKISKQKGQKKAKKPKLSDLAFEF